MKSQDNVADEGTKWKGIRKIEMSNGWIAGAPFLFRPETEWPRGRVTSEELDPAQDRVFREIQRSTYGKLIDQLEYIEKLKEKGNSNTDLSHMYIHACGELIEHSPFLDKKGLLRRKSRNQSSVYSYAFKNPVLLPSDHPLIDLLVNTFHETNFHSYDDTVIGDLREFCWIMNLRRVLKRVKSNCGECKAKKLKPIMPEMGNLPDFRVDFSSISWTHTGVDAFGPIYVKQQRSTVKRWVLLFTCLTYRAVHMEVVRSPSANDCMLAIRRFLVGRPGVKHFYSDNGGCFIKSAKLLEKDFLDLKAVSEQLARIKRIEWHFIPVYSPWFGGAWENSQCWSKKVSFVHFPT